jgi:hypothetical protein
VEAVEAKDITDPVLAPPAAAVPPVWDLEAAEGVAVAVVVDGAGKVA